MRRATQETTMDATMILQARAQCCRACAFASDRSGQEAELDLWECRHGPPRTSGPVRWPRVRPDSEYCGAFQPLHPAPAPAQATRTGSLAIGGRL